MPRPLETTGIKLPVHILEGVESSQDLLRQDRVQAAERNKYIDPALVPTFENIGSHYLSRGYFVAALHVKELLQHYGKGRMARKSAKALGNRIHGLYQMTNKIDTERRAQATLQAPDTSL